MCYYIPKDLTTLGLLLLLVSSLSSSPVPYPDLCNQLDDNKWKRRLSVVSTLKVAKSEPPEHRVLKMDCISNLIK